MESDRDRTHNWETPGNTAPSSFHCEIRQDLLVDSKLTKEKRGGRRAEGGGRSSVGEPMSICRANASHIGEVWEEQLLPVSGIQYYQIYHSWDIAGLLKQFIALRPMNCFPTTLGCVYSQMTILAPCYYLPPPTPQRLGAHYCFSCLIVQPTPWRGNGFLVCKFCT